MIGALALVLLTVQTVCLLLVLVRLRALGLDESPQWSAEELLTLDGAAPMFADMPSDAELRVRAVDGDSLYLARGNRPREASDLVGFSGYLA